MLHQSSTVIIGAGSCWLFLLLGWATSQLVTDGMRPIQFHGLLRHDPPNRQHMVPQTDSLISTWTEAVHTARHTQYLQAVSFMRPNPSPQSPQQPWCSSCSTPQASTSTHRELQPLRSYYNPHTGTKHLPNKHCTTSAINATQCYNSAVPSPLGCC
jgi:hypothetical protein